MHWSTYQDLLPEDLESTEHQTTWEAFYASVAIKCGTIATVEDLDELVAVKTPAYFLYEDANRDIKCPKAPPEEL